METKTCLNGYEQEVRNIMVMEQLDRFNTVIDTELFDAFLILKLLFGLGVVHNLWHSFI